MERARILGLLTIWQGLLFFIEWSHFYNGTLEGWRLFSFFVGLAFYGSIYTDRISEAATSSTSYHIVLFGVSLYTLGFLLRGVS